MACDPCLAGQTRSDDLARMHEAPAALYFDFTDPLSYLVELELTALVGSTGHGPTRLPFELRPPPTPLTVVSDPLLATRWDTATTAAAGLGVTLSPPRLVPWSRKAHELHLFARSREAEGSVRAATFEAYFQGGLDIGRVDVLVEIGRACGLDPTETKAVLDVDRFEEEVRTSRDEAVAAGVRDTPLLVRGAGRLQGFHNRVSLGTFLRYP
jgi:predicted DsbA family dithiol-disulfide isomerase